MSNYNEICEHGFPSPCRECDLRAKLAAAKAELEDYKKALAILKREATNDAEDYEAIESENKRLRDHIHRNEDKSVECERLREALIHIKGQNREPSFSIAKSALDGKGGEA